VALRDRLRRLERQLTPATDGWELFSLPSAEEQATLRAKIAGMIGAAGPRAEVSADELRAGLDEVKAFLRAAVARYEAAHEWKWVDGCCYVRQRPAGLR
jgi:hypothetical protein